MKIKKLKDEPVCCKCGKVFKKDSDIVFFKCCGWEQKWYYKFNKILLTSEWKDPGVNIECE
jgi:predicted  nucleic acid-binding Zn-ribbon protein